ncbi:Major Facilitator Superfamily protein [Actinacidiphila alni]|uniref:Major Facilitator Superfamily protein n=1 Tax=Actinacidiphila alni TaxID=380248 RepID=A0A1I2J736_9ACTN|nr:MFS transporter [Actinacidiphila alni]SFF50344.1 Major Facilitator Superfamily protein [Actinacidiphila alni]
MTFSAPAVPGRSAAVRSTPVPPVAASASVPRSVPAQGTGRAGPRAGLLLAIILTGQFMALLDVFIVNVAAPTIRTDLHASGAGLQLVIAGYSIAYAVLLITGARLGDLLGHRRLFLAGLALFTVSSLACGLARNTGELIGFRFVQGTGSALMIPQVLSLLQLTFTGEARTRAMSVYSAVIASGAALGQSLGGVLVSADLFGTGWRPVFLVNVPIGLLMLVVAPRVLPADSGGAPGRRRGLDLPGLVVLAAAVTLLTVPLVLGQEEGWPLWGWFSLGASVLLFALFMVLEARLARRGGAPLVSTRVLRAPGMPRAVTVIALTMAVNAGFLFSIALHLQSGLGLSALRTGLTFAACAVTFGTVGLTWRRLPAAARPWLAPAGLLVAGASFAGLGLALRGGGHGGALLYLALLTLGAGLGFAFSPTLTLALGKVAPRDAADASGLLATVTQLGQLLGVATLGTLYLNRLGPAGPHTSAHAYAVTSAALAVVAVVAALVAVEWRRRRA